eukprot:2673556-Rhodomonas_salina.1
MQAPRRPSLRPVTFVMDSPAAPTQTQPRAPAPLTHQNSISRLRPLPLPVLRTSADGVSGRS